MLTYLRVNCARNAICELRIELREGRGGWVSIGAGLLNIADGSRLNQITNYKLLDCFVLGNATSAVCAAGEANVSAPMLRTAVIPTLACHSSIKILNSLQSGKAKKVQATMGIRGYLEFLGEKYFAFECLDST